LVADLENISTNTPGSLFSDNAFLVFKEKVNEYFLSLIIESNKISKRNKTEQISADHVEQASANLISNNRSKISQLLGTLGGILLGAVVAYVIAIYNTSTPIPPNTVIINLGLGILGMALIFYQFSNS
jgi:hypothetical protein